MLAGADGHQMMKKAKLMMQHEGGWRSPFGMAGQKRAYSNIGAFIDKAKYKEREIIDDDEVYSIRLREGPGGRISSQGSRYSKCSLPEGHDRESEGRQGEDHSRGRR